MAAKTGTEFMQKREAVQFRTSKELQRREGTLKYEPDAHSLELTQLTRSELGETLEVALPQISVFQLESVCLRNYRDRANSSCCLILSMKNEEQEQYSIQFERAEMFEAWEAGLQVLLARSPTSPSAGGGGKRTVRNTARKGAEPPSTPSTLPQVSPRDVVTPLGSAASPNKRFGSKRANSGAELIPATPTAPLSSARRAGVNPITNVTLLRPSNGMILSMKLELSGSREEVLEIPRKASSSEDCKLIVKSFIERNLVSAREAASLYRYIRSVVQRINMELETDDILNLMHELHFDTVAQLASEDSTGKDVERVAEQEFQSIEANLNERIGSNGSGGVFLMQILKRSIEKMRRTNEIAAKCYDIF
eukprot:TRINITY_DN20558_c0_g2_i1.p1 TRINITY_DN20558_c0_g2~~TRINITY_DN20558_c0_g2_i1.p1  ORF type:complete len:365 (+),score=65.43 TRINITY_DN20558_c0_g2_i1:81-1175(+)